MKKYRVRVKNSAFVFGEFSSKKEASIKLMEYINDVNKDLDESFLSPFEYEIEVVECGEVNEVITDFESAKKYLVGKINDVFGVVKKRLSKSIDPIKDAEILIKELNPKHIEALVALNRLFTIAEAWNKEDGFVPDFSDWNQNKWYPWFKYDKDAAGFVCTTVNYTTASAYLGSRLCFKTRERAEQFGKQFVELFNKVFLPK